MRPPARCERRRPRATVACAEQRPRRSLGLLGGVQPVLVLSSPRCRPRADRVLISRRGKSGHGTVPRARRYCRMCSLRVRGARADTHTVLYRPIDTRPYASTTHSRGDARTAWPVRARYEDNTIHWQATLSSLYRKNASRRGRLTLLIIAAPLHRRLTAAKEVSSRDEAVRDGPSVACSRTRTREWRPRQHLLLGFEQRRRM
jgi:hypothetical protein